MPCVIYCHGNCGCRVDALDAVQLLLPKGITVFCFDFSGSGLSDGEYVSLGFYEVQDVLSVVSHLQQTKGVSKISLWGRSMGAATSLMFTGRSTDNSISSLVVDSGFISLEEIIKDLIHNFRSWIPNAVVKIATDSLRKSIATKALFDIHENHPLKYVARLKCPVLFAHAEGDNFIKKKHSEELYKNYGGEKSIIFFEGDHNTSRPEFFFDQVATFFERTLLEVKLTVEEKPEEKKSPGTLLEQSKEKNQDSVCDSSTLMTKEASNSSPKAEIKAPEIVVHETIDLDDVIEKDGNQHPHVVHHSEPVPLSSFARNQSFTIKKSDKIEHDVVPTGEQVEITEALIRSLQDDLKTCQNEEEKRSILTRIDELKQNKELQE
jgi:pimeloyl-ACP methyl ester carboxylesterase